MHAEREEGEREGRRKGERGEEEDIDMVESKVQWSSSSPFCLNL